MSDETTDEISFGEAMAELERLLRAIEDDEVDLDDLADHVGRAAELIQTCRGKLERTELQVKRIIKDLEQDEAEDG